MSKHVPYNNPTLPASNWVLKRMKASRWLPLLVAVWGTVTTLTGLVQSFSGLIAIRFFLGFCEGGLLPGMILYLSTLYKPHELQQRFVWTFRHVDVDVLNDRSVSGSSTRPHLYRERSVVSIFNASLIEFD
ncbi:hypothetical protein EIP86_004799 [Pleurotus ostreatoroseus]|nr:hypothetical protein EIP86_004799 [Pleurotus ostreatoroseus]